MRRTLRSVLLIALAVLAALSHGPVRAEQGGPPAVSSDPFFGLETYRLWQGRAEAATADEPDQTPTLTIFRPQPGRANGAAVVVAPGGGYVTLAGTLEGREVADWFTSHGVTAFVLKYRIGEKSRLPVRLRMAGARFASSALMPLVSRLILPVLE